MPLDAYVVQPGYQGTDATNYCFRDEAERADAHERAMARIDELLDNGATVTVYQAGDDAADLCSECEADDCEMRQPQ